MEKPTFQLLDENGRPRGSVDFEGDELVLGRDVVARLGGGSDGSVSRRHARVVREENSLTIEDLGSLNGTLVNGTRIAGRLVIKSGDMVEVGRQRFRLVEAGFEERPADSAYEAATITATRAGAPERLRLIYDLTHFVGRPVAPREIAERIVGILKRSVAPQSIAVWLAGDSEPAAGGVEGVPFTREVLESRVLNDGQVLRVPTGGSPATAIALPLAPSPEPVAVLAVVAASGRGFSDEDTAFVFAVAALAGGAMRRTSRERAARIDPGGDEIVGESAAITRAKRDVDLVAPYEDLSVLLLGETGTGKELFARRLHAASGRPGPFVPVNVAALPEELLEGELFGSAKGAYTGAVAARVGYFEYAASGTLFLDEVGEIPAALQVKLLRVLQDKKMNRVGDPRPQPVDVRVVAATNADLRAKITAGVFREDLYYRLAGKEVVIPPLRDREGDIALLVAAFVRRNLGRTPRPVRAASDAAMRLLSAYEWPGNVRQLEGTVRLAVIHAAASGAAEVAPEHLDPRVVSGSKRPPPESLGDELAESERKVVVKALRAAKGNRREAARRLGWSINTLRDRLERYTIAESEWSG